MLPVHRSSPSEVGRLSKWPSFFFRKPLVRWLVLACVVIAVIWFGDLLSLGESELLLRPWDSSTATATATNHLHLPSIVPLPPTKEEQDVWEPRKSEVRNAFKHAWSGYKSIAYPYDELLPVSGGRSNKYNGWGVTLFDSLDTLWIMGLRDEFADALDSIRDFRFHATRPNHFAGFFEVTIRYLGGTLSAYALSRDTTLLHHAERLGQMLLPAFNGTKTGVPAYSVNVETGETLADGNKDTILFAEATSCQLEFKYLAKLTANKEYYEKVEKAMDVFYRANVTDSLFQNQWYKDNGKPDAQHVHITIGATTDSGYEYLLKQWIQSGDSKARLQYIKSATGIINKLIYQTPNRGLLYVGDIFLGSFNHRLEHFSCYLPGILALGAFSLPDNELPPRQKQIHRWAAHGLAYTCAMLYEDQELGLAPEEIKIMKGGRRWMEVVDEWELGGRQGDVPPGMGESGSERDWRKRLGDYSVHQNSYYLRPEAIESFFIMWRTTGDVKWREHGYKIFQAIQKHTRTKFGYSTVRGISGSVQLEQLDDMPSWFLAETLKYLYLLFDDTNSFKLDEWVFNTEAHPLPVFSWTAKERGAFGI